MTNQVTEFAPTVQGLMDLYLASKRVFNGKYESVEGMPWRASSLGYCLKRQFLDANGVPHLVEPDQRTLRLFFLGDEIARAIQKALWHLGVLIYPERPGGEELAFHDTQLRLGGHVDCVIGGKVQPLPEGLSEDQAAFLNHIRRDLWNVYGGELPVVGVELKSTRSDSWHWAAKRNEPVAGLHQRMQAAAYDILNSRQETPIHVDKWCIVNFSKDDALMAETGFGKAEKDKVYEVLATLNGCLDGAGTPPCTCFEDWGGRAWRYCPYYQGSEQSRKGKTPKPDGGCC